MGHKNFFVGAPIDMQLSFSTIQKTNFGPFFRWVVSPLFEKKKNSFVQP